MPRCQSQAGQRSDAASASGKTELQSEIDDVTLYQQKILAGSEALLSAPQLARAQGHSMALAVFYGMRRA